MASQVVVDYSANVESKLEETIIISCSWPDRRRPVRSVTVTRED